MSESDNPPGLPQVAMGGVTRSPNFQYLFTNHVRVRVGAGEVAIAFSFADEIGTVPIQTEMMAVGMSPLQARRLAVLLTEIIKSYESTFGPIPPEPAPGTAPNGAEVMRRVDEIIKDMARK